MTKKPKDLIVGDVFEEPENEEEFHGEIEVAEPHPKYRVDEIIRITAMGFTELIVTRLDNHEKIPMIIAPWVPLVIV